ncbi:MAG: CRISPR-associated endonuclease Cas1 [Verrucomicrobiales bacterium]
MGNELSSTLPEEWATVDMVAQFTYCPRRFHLMYVEGRWEDNIHTLEGKDVHRRVDRIDHLLPESKTGADGESGAEPAATPPEGDDPPPEIARSVSLGCEKLGLMGKLDLVSADPEGGEAIPVETKKSRVPATPEKSFPPERAQLMAQALLLRAHGYRSEHGYLYFAGSRVRVWIDFTFELEVETRQTIKAIQAARATTVMPPPLEDSPKCWGCSLCGICLPDETNALRTVPDAEAESASTTETAAPDSHAGPDIRRLFAARDRAMPFYVQEQGARVGKTGERLTFTKQKETIGGARLIEVSQVVLMGNVQVSAQALHLFMEKGIPVVHLSTGGWFHGVSHGINIENAYARSDQYAAAASPARCTAFAWDLVIAKAANQRALLLRNGSGTERDTGINGIAVSIRKIRQCDAGSEGGDANTDVSPHPDSQASSAGASAFSPILGWEGQAAALYFAAFSSMLKTGELAEFHFNNRNRRPPRDPVNALLSFAYALLAKECLVALWGEGLDPWWGLYHQPRHGRPALALDLMEPFRPIIADSVVITAINTGMVSPGDFVNNANGCALLPSGRKAFLRAWEQRLDQLYTHPEFDYRCSWRTILRIQARLLTRWLRGDIPTIPWPVVR